ncbi:helix-turn-helix domain-containing protein [Solimicrobium silvestre]|nr:helix-turn-helix transcriptional regulator [Solimicrobium silvestre]
MPTIEEKVSFSKRLDASLRRSPEPVKGATELALRFNLRYVGDAVSAQTAHKWLTGRAIPTHDKLATIAKWLNVDEHWLHYGASPAGTNVRKHAAPAMNDVITPEVITLAQRILLLPPHQRYLIEDLIAQLRQE